MMMIKISNLALVACLCASALFSVSCASGPGGNRAASSNVDARKIDAKSRKALDKLYLENPRSKALGKQARGVLIFPKIVKGGVGLGGAVGVGTLYQRNKPTTFYRSITASYGLQLGLQKYGYALFLMDGLALQNLNSSGGWELGTDPNITVLDKGVAGSLSTTTVDERTYAVFFNQVGLMAGFSLSGNKITRLNIKP
jgi:lipid-binding SYLF domain-containing protein